jgi:hypothetical protein
MVVIYVGYIISFLLAPHHNFFFGPHTNKINQKLGGEEEKERSPNKLKSCSRE